MTVKQAIALAESEADKHIAMSKICEDNIVRHGHLEVAEALLLLARIKKLEAQS